jgi:uncharacterized protein (DUF2235 family)
MAHPLHVAPSPNPKQFVLCFDGTGNKFAGDDSDSNVLKIFRVCQFFQVSANGCFDLGC